MQHPGSATIVAPSFDAAHLEITRLRALRGANYWRDAPVIACDLALGSLDGVSSRDVPGFTERLLAALPTLREHPCSRGAAGGFVERVREGTEIPHILEHVAIELQALVGDDVRFGRVRPAGEPGAWWVIVEYVEEEVGLQSMRDAVTLVRHCLVDEPVDVAAMVEALVELSRAVRLGPSTAAIVEEALRRGIPVRRLNSGSLVRLGLGRNLRRIQATISDLTSGIAMEIAQDKDDTKRVLESIGLPVPPGTVASSLEAALEAADALGYPVLIKPLSASHGRGISGELADAAALRAAWAVAREHGRDVVVERFSSGRDHRVLVVNGRVVACAERVAAHVVGDGTRSIRALIEAANRDPRRGVGHANILTRLPMDAHTEEFLAQRARTLDTVPEAGERVDLRATANLSTGGTSLDRTDEMHPDNRTACEMAAGAIGLDIAGLDVLTPSISVPFRENGAVIIEVNAGPGIRMHTHPAEGTPRNVAAPILDMLYPPGSDFTIPVIAVTGTNGKTTTTRLIAHLFRHTGLTVGFTTTDGVYLQNRLVMEGDMTGPFAANIVLSNRTVDVAVLETARGGILRAGLGFDECDVAVVLNVSEDHIGLAGIHSLQQLADVKSVLAGAVKREGHAVLNADDPLVLAMRERTIGDLVLFSTQPPGSNPAFDEHLANNGIGAGIEDGTFVVRRGRLRIPIAQVHEVPLTLEGSALFQFENVLAAIATAYVRGIRYDDIRAGLLTFFPSASLTPGRLNLLRVGRGRVLVDYAHNAAAVRGLVDVVRRLPAKRRIGVLAVPGDRRDEDIRAVGRLSAGLDHVVIKEDADPRGRAPGETARLIAEGLLAAGQPPETIEHVPSESAAVARAVALRADGDLAFVLAEDVRAILRQLRPTDVPAPAPAPNAA